MIYFICDLCIYLCIYQLFMISFCFCSQTTTSSSTSSTSTNNTKRGRGSLCVGKFPVKLKGFGPGSERQNNYVYLFYF